MANIETLLKKAYDIVVHEIEPDRKGFSSPGVYIWLHEKDDDGSEPLGHFVKLEDCMTYQWRNVHSNVESGTAFDDAMLRKALKNRAFHSIGNYSVP